MIFKLHYTCMTSGACALSILMGVFIKEYTDANTLEVGALFMIMPFVQLFSKPIICSMADRDRAHRDYIMACLLILALGYTPFVIIPFLGPAVYEAHPRICWYFLASVKIIGDIGFGGAISIGDTLAVNYAKRTGRDYCVYRMYGSASWMIFGFFVGQVNEIWFLPKFTPAFMLLITAAIVNTSIYWLWPAEYFRIVTLKTIQEEKQAASNDRPRTLMSNEAVRAHMKAKIASLFCMGGGSVPDAETKVAEITEPENHEERPQVRKQISKTTQLKIIALLFRRDLRIPLYLLFFVLCGMACARLNFFFMGLAEKCEREGSCQFSAIAGYLQVAMASVETVLLRYIRQIVVTIGRVNTCTALTLIVAIKNLFYGTIWVSINPYYSLLVEPLQGIMFAFIMATTIEMAYTFGNEVQYIIPELQERRIITEDDDMDAVKGSIMATMQAFASSCLDGLGRGVGALLYGLLLEYYTYEDLWFGIGVSATIIAGICVAINIFDHIFKLRLGLDVQAEQNNRTLDQIENKTV